MIMSQVLGEPLGWVMSSEGPWLCTGKNSRASHSKVKTCLFREYTFYRQSVGYLGEQEAAPGHDIFSESESVPRCGSG